MVCEVIDIKNFKEPTKGRFGNTCDYEFHKTTYYDETHDPEEIQDTETYSIWFECCTVHLTKVYPDRPVMTSQGFISVVDGLVYFNFAETVLPAPQEIQNTYNELYQLTSLAQ